MVGGGLLVLTYRCRVGGELHPEIFWSGFLTFFFFFFRTGLRRQSDPRSVRGSGRRHFDRGAHVDLPKQ